MHTFLFFFILLEGFASIAIEIITMRQLLPYVGNSVVINSIIIGVFLLFLSLGYYRGGLVTKNFQTSLGRNFLIAGFISSFGFSTAFLNLIVFVLDRWHLQGPIVFLTIFLSLILAPIIFYLGQTIPITFNLFPQDRGGLITSRVLFFSTIGSFLGSIFTAAFLFDLIGVSLTIWLVSSCILLLAIFIDKRSKNALFKTAFALSTIVITKHLLKDDFIRTTAYGNYQVINDYKLSKNPEEMGKLLLINSSHASFLNKQQKSFDYIEKIKKIMFEDLKLTHQKILVLGAGGFTLSSENTHENEFTYIDIDKHIKSIVKNNFNTHIKGQFVSADARLYVKNKHAQYNVIVFDAYAQLMAIPSHLLTQENFADIRNSLTENGYFIMNFIANPMLNDQFSQTVDNTLHSIFPHCMAETLNYGAQLANIIYVCKKNSRNIRDIYTDNLNTASKDSFAMGW
jgi:spermidine synthase